MKKRIITLFAAIVAFAVGINSQEVKPAPTLEVCNAQVNLWVAQMDISRPYGPEVREVLNALTSKDLSDREGLITGCMSANTEMLRGVPEGPQRVARAQKLEIRLDEALSLLRLYSMEQRTRYFHFIARNKLIPKFDQEDRGER